MMLACRGTKRFISSKSSDGALVTTACRRWFSSQDRLDHILRTYVVHRRGDSGHGSREYMLCPADKTIEECKADNLTAAALLAHRNIIFGARSFHDEYPLEQICLPLVETAVKDACKDGEQAQAIASLSGLSSWVSSCLEGSMESDELNKLKETDRVGFEAVESIATGIPRKGHSVVGIGTYRDAENGWKAVGREYVERNLSDEANLYQRRGAKVVAIEHLADKNPEYLQTAGGAMARMFFL
jgi:hypothetical protein